MANDYFMDTLRDAARRHTRITVFMAILLPLSFAGFVYFPDMRKAITLVFSPSVREWLFWGCAGIYLFALHWCIRRIIQWRHLIRFAQNQEPVLAVFTGAQRGPYVDQFRVHPEDADHPLPGIVEFDYCPLTLQAISEQPSASVRMMTLLQDGGRHNLIVAFLGEQLLIGRRTVGKVPCGTMYVEIACRLLMTAAVIVLTGFVFSLQSRSGAQNDPRQAGRVMTLPDGTLITTSCGMAVSSSEKQRCSSTPMTFAIIPLSLVSIYLIWSTKRYNLLPPS